MSYNLLADLVMLLHFGFILFAVAGALLVARWPRLIWLHLPAALWAMTIEFYGGVCPLTPLENWLRHRGGQMDHEMGYGESFIQHHLGGVIYPAGMTTAVEITLGLALLAINLALYGWISKRRHPRHSP